MSEQSSQSSRSLPQPSGSKHQNLSGARLEKKRTMDRECQRAGRERTRNYIRHLEMLVESLRQVQGDDRLKALVQQYEELRGQNERLISTISSISRLSRTEELLHTPTNNSNTSTVTLPPATTSGTVIEYAVDQQPRFDGASGVDPGHSSPTREIRSLWPQPSLTIVGEHLPPNPLLICPGSSPRNPSSRTLMYLTSIPHE
jgi:hypothetical protein